jgi:hypothetical protein
MLLLEAINKTQGIHKQPLDTRHKSLNVKSFCSIYRWQLYVSPKENTSPSKSNSF